jgi:hypothetical protein
VPYTALTGSNFHLIQVLGQASIKVTKKGFKRKMSKKGKEEKTSQLKVLPTLALVWEWLLFKMSEAFFRTNLEQ